VPTPFRLRSPRRANSGGLSEQAEAPGMGNQPTTAAWKAAREAPLSFLNAIVVAPGVSSCHFFFGLPLLPRLCRALIVVCPAAL
jgi:hypothetical protein